MISLETKSECCGCGACVYVCPVNVISFIEDELGFRYPKTDQVRCINCNKCLKICPNIQQNDLKRYTASRWLGLRHVDDGVLCGSSSGGAFTSILQAVSGATGVAPITYGAAWASLNVVEHIRIAPGEDISPIRKSKYLQSSLDKIFDLIAYDLKNGEQVIFSGTPCQVAAVESLFGKNEHLITVEVVCKGVGSLVAYNEWILWLERKYGYVASVDFRVRERAERPSVVTVCFKNGKKYHTRFNTNDDPFTSAYLQGFICRHSCNNCSLAGVRRCADFTIGDYWGGLRDPNMKFPIENGTSFIALNTKTAESLADNISVVAETFEADGSNVQNNNLSLIKPSKPLLNQEDYIASFVSEGFIEAGAKFVKTRSIFRKMISNILHGRGW